MTYLVYIFFFFFGITTLMVRHCDVSSSKRVTCLARGHSAVPHQSGGTVLCAQARHILCLVLVQPRKTHPDMTENVDWDVKNQNKTMWMYFIVVCSMDEYIHLHASLTSFTAVFLLDITSRDA